MASAAESQLTTSPPQEDPVPEAPGPSAAPAAAAPATSSPVAPAPAAIAATTAANTTTTTSQATVSLIPVQASDIPTTAAELTTYLSSLHKQAYELVSALSDTPNAPWKHHSTKKHGGHTVETFARETVSGASEEEHWFGRRSRHTLMDGLYVEEGGKRGLHWADFTNYLFKNHAENEQNYIGSVKRVDKIDLSSKFETSGVKLEGWKDVGFGIYAIHHSLPWPLHPRVFPIALFTAMKEDDNEFIVVSLPVSLPKDTEAEVVDSDGKATKRAKVFEGTTSGRYVAVELVRKVEGEGSCKNAIWMMGTASDAEGNLPMAVQKRSIPGTIAKDVPWFCDWIEKKGA